MRYVKVGEPAVEEEIQHDDNTEHLAEGSPEPLVRAFRGRLHLCRAGVGRSRRAPFQHGHSGGLAVRAPVVGGCRSSPVRPGLTA